MTEKIKLLLVEDDKILHRMIKENLEEKGYDVKIAEDGQKAIELIGNNKFHLIILDVMLPKLDGFQVTKFIRQNDQVTPIIFLTALSTIEDKIKGLAIGGDDYISKPFSMEELLLKIKIFLKRTSEQSNIPSIPEQSIQIGKFLFNPDDLSLTIDEKIKNLTIKEAQLIKLFAENENKVLTRSTILKKLWDGDDYFMGRSLDVFISRLRKYFKPDPTIKIINLHGVGFRFSIVKSK